MALIDEARRRDLIGSIPTGGYPQAPAADGSQSNPLNNDVGRAVTNTLSALPGAGAVPGAASAGSGLVARAFGASAPAASALGQVAQRVAPYAPVAGGAAALNLAASASTPPAAAAAERPQSIVQAAGLGGPGLAGTSSPPAMTPVAESLAARASSAGPVSAQDDAAAENLASRQGLVGYAQAQQPPNVQAPTVRHSGNDWQSRNDLRNAEVSASSITNTRRWGGRGAESSPDVMAYQSALATDQVLKQAQPGLAAEATRGNVSLQREGIQQAGADRRSLAQAGIDQQRVAMDRESQGYANRASAQQEQLRATLTDPNATPAQRQAAQQALGTLSGRQQQGDWRVQVTPTTKNVDGSTSEGSVIRFNQATGQAERVDVGQGGQATQTPLANPSTRPVGTLSTVGGKTAQWDGQKWVPRG